MMRRIRCQCAVIPIGYSAVFAAECLIVINKVSEEVVHNDLLVGNCMVQV